MNEKSEYERLKLAMDSVGFSRISQKNMFSVLSAVLLLGNTEYVKVFLYFILISLNFLTKKIPIIYF